MPSHILHLLTPNQRDSENEVYEMESLVKLGELGEATENSEDSFKHFISKTFHPQPEFICSKLTKETLEQGVRYVQS